jgi:hypothetical protein
MRKKGEKMKVYYGTRCLKATAMNRLDYNTYRGWKLPDDDENGWDQGYLVEDLSSNLKNHVAHDGYISWLPKEEFERTYKVSGQMSFGHALEALKAGERIARAGWNGKDMWLALSCAETRLVPANGFSSPQNRAWAHQNGGSAKVLPSITMKTADGSILMGWLASQSDMLSDDWMIVS